MCEAALRDKEYFVDPYLRKVSWSFINGMPRDFSNSKMKVILLLDQGKGVQNCGQSLLSWPHVSQRVFVK